MSIATTTTIAAAAAARAKRTRDLRRDSVAMRTASSPNIATPIYNDGMTHSDKRSYSGTKRIAANTHAPSGTVANVRPSGGLLRIRTPSPAALAIQKNTHSDAPPGLSANGWNWAASHDSVAATPEPAGGSANAQ